MSSKFFGAKKGIAITLITMVLAISSSMFIAPRPVHAQITVTSSIANLIVEALNWIASNAGAIGSVDTALSVNSDWVKEYVLDPLAWVMSQKSLQSMTGSVVGFINGKGNGTGKSQFIQNLPNTLKTVGDTQAYSFFAKFNTRSGGSAFDAAISSALRNRYLQGSTLAGFFAANKSTLSNFTCVADSNGVCPSGCVADDDAETGCSPSGGAVSPSTNAFLKGNWSKGGAAAWLALTTQNQNNPYTLYRTAQSQMYGLVTNMQETQKSTFSWAKGMTSWCGGSNNAIDTSEVNCPSGQVLDLQENVCVDPDTGEPTGSIPVKTGSTEPGDPCIDKDGIAGTIQTPGGLIADQLSRVAGINIDKTVMADEMSEVLGNIAVSFVVDILGGSSGGLAGVSKSGSGGGRSLINSLVNENPTNPTDPTTIIHQKLAKIETYKRSWDKIEGLTKAASATTTKFKNHCLSGVAEAKATGRTDLDGFIEAATRWAEEVDEMHKPDGEIGKVFDQIAKTNTFIIDAMSMIGRVQYAASSTAATDSIPTIGANKANLTGYTTVLANVIKTDYTKTSWDAYREVVEDLFVKTTDSKRANNDQGSVDSATTKIGEEQVNLKRASDPTKLNKYKTALNAVKEADYTTESWSKYQIVVNANKVTAENTQREIDAATAKIKDAQVDLIPKEGVTASTSNSNNGEEMKRQLAADLSTLQEMIPTADDVADSEALSRQSKNVAQAIHNETGEGGEENTDPYDDSLEITVNDSDSIVDVMIYLITITDEYGKFREFEHNLWEACTVPSEEVPPGG